MQRLSAARPLLGLLLAGAFVCAPTPAFGQVETLDPKLITMVSLSGGDRERVQTFVQAQLAGLTSDDFTRVRRSRAALLAPLGQSSATASFRDAYAGALWPTVETLIESEDAAQRLTGMRLAGGLGTERAADRLIGLLDSDDEGIRVFAAGRLGEVLGSITPNSATLSPEGASRVIEALGKTIRQDPQTRAADAAARSLGVATEIRPGLLNDARSRAITVLSEASGERVRGAELDKGTIGFALRASGIVRTSVAKNEAMSAPASKAAIGLGADVLSRVLEGFDPQQDTLRELEVGLVRAAESVVYFSRRRHAETTGRGGQVPETDLATKLASDNARDLRDFPTDTVQLLSALERDYGFDRGRFVPGP
ncbi:MAG: hypothetical protein DHS20C14_10320 [Phycisphaeraceae bacterium]|nr:MAG: hypothetical protein DHS20C14_10320 [Phycisphaeraceae bacterium]